MWPFELPLVGHVVLLLPNLRSACFCKNSKPIDQPTAICTIIVVVCCFKMPVLFWGPFHFCRGKSPKYHINIKGDMNTSKTNQSFNRIPLYVSGRKVLLFLINLIWFDLIWFDMSFQRLHKFAILSLPVELRNVCTNSEQKAAIFYTSDRVMNRCSAKRWKLGQRWSSEL